MMNVVIIVKPGTGGRARLVIRGPYSRKHIKMEENEIEM